MSVANATFGDGRVVSCREERRVIFASSLGFGADQEGGSNGN
jgi:hypothetical protein